MVSPQFEVRSTDLIRAKVVNEDSLFKVVRAEPYIVRLRVEIRESSPGLSSLACTWGANVPLRLVWSELRDCVVVTLICLKGLGILTVVTNVDKSLVDGLFKSFTAFLDE